MLAPPDEAHAGRRWLNAKKTKEQKSVLLRLMAMHVPDVPCERLNWTINQGDHDGFEVRRDIGFTAM